MDGPHSPGPSRAGTHARDTELEALRAERDACWQEMWESNRLAAALARENGELRARIAALEPELAQREAVLEQVRASTSWRLTRPVRALRRLLTTGRLR